MQRSVVGSGLLLLSLTGAAVAQLPLGPEQQANSSTTGAQHSPRVSSDSTGAFLVVWGDGTDATVWVRRFDAAGAPQGPERRVNRGGGGNVWRWPTGLLVDSDAEFTVVWSGYQGGPGCFCAGGRARRFESGGEPLGDGFVVAGMVRYGIPPVAVGRANGDFVVATKESSPIDLTRYSSTGVVQGQAEIVAEENHDHASPALAIAPSGEFVVAWNDWEYSLYPWSLVWDRILLQRFDAEGVPAGTAVEVTPPESEGHRWRPRVARSGTGTFLVVWDEDPSESGNAEPVILRARLYDAQGNPSGMPFQVNDLTPGSQNVGQAIAAPDGSFIVTWTDRFDGGGGGDGSGSGLRARHFAVNGIPTGASFPLNSYAPGDQRSPSLAFLPNGDFLAAWSSEGSFGSDDSEASIQVRRFRLAFFADGFETGDASRWSAVGG